MPGGTRLLKGGKAGRVARFGIKRGKGARCSFVGSMVGRTHVHRNQASPLCSRAASDSVILHKKKRLRKLREKCVWIIARVDLRIIGRLGCRNPIVGRLCVWDMSGVTIALRIGDSSPVKISAPLRNRNCVVTRKEICFVSSTYSSLSCDCSRQ